MRRGSGSEMQGSNHTDMTPPPHAHEQRSPLYGEPPRTAASAAGPRAVGRRPAAVEEPFEKKLGVIQRWLRALDLGIDDRAGLTDAIADGVLLVRCVAHFGTHESRLFVCTSHYTPVLHSVPLPCR